MKVYLLIHEQNTNTVCGSNAKPFTDMQAAQNAMRDGWKKSMKIWKYDSHEHRNGDKAMCDETVAVIREDNEDEWWYIEEQELDVQVVVRVEGGLVKEVQANADVKVDVYDLDVSDFPNDGEQDEAGRKEAELAELIKSPIWRVVW